MAPKFKTIMTVTYHWYYHCVQIHVCTISEVIGMKKKKSLPKKEYIGDHRCKRTNIAPKC